MAISFFRKSKLGEMVGETKKHFPKAEVIEFREDTTEGLFEHD